MTLHKHWFQTNTCVYFNICINKKGKTELCTCWAVQCLSSMESNRKSISSHEWDTMLSDNKIPLGMKILKQLQNALTTKQGNTFIYCTHEKLYWKGNWRCGLWLRHTNTILPLWPVSPTVELIRPINNQRTTHFLPQPNKKLDQYWISSNPLIFKFKWMRSVTHPLTCCSSGWWMWPHWLKYYTWETAFKNILLLKY